MVKQTVRNGSCAKNHYLRVFDTYIRGWLTVLLSSSGLSRPPALLHDAQDGHGFPLQSPRHRREC